MRRARAARASRLESFSDCACTQMKDVSGACAASSRSSSSSAAAPLPVCDAIGRPVRRLVNAAACTSFVSIAERGAPSTPIFMNAGLIDVPSMPRSASPVHRAASCSAVSVKANAGTCLSFAAP